MEGAVTSFVQARREGAQLRSQGCITPVSQPDVNARPDVAAKMQRDDAAGVHLSDLG